jgi:hypothetical protein
MTTAAAYWMGLIGGLGCSICRRLGRGFVPAQVHHIAVGSGKRSDFAVANLCQEHHDPNRTGSGFHGMGTDQFCRIFRIPGEREEGLLVLAAEDLARHLKRGA